MKNKMLLIVLGLSLLNCQNPKAENPPPAPTEIAVTGNPENKVQTATNSLDYLGTYKDKDKTLQLSEDFTYSITTISKGKPVEIKGTFRWNDDNSIVLENVKGLNSYRVEDNSLILVGNDGKNTADILKKLPEAVAAKEDALPRQTAPQVIGIRWKLVELNGKAVQKEGDKDYFIEFMPENNFKAFAGCNNLSGHYEYKDNRMHFMRIVGTMKACPSMVTEEKFKETLEDVNGFTINDKIMQFRKDDSFIAKFEAVSKPK